MTAATMEEIVYPDGRHELNPETDAALGGSPLHNQDLAPVALPRRTWTTYNYLALWVGMSINIPSWALAAGLIAIGMDWVQAIITIGLGNVIVLIPMLLISHSGTKYGIPYPVVSRAAFGVSGATCPRSCAPGWPAAGSASRPGSAASPSSASGLRSSARTAGGRSRQGLDRPGDAVSQPGPCGSASSSSGASTS